MVRGQHIYRATTWTDTGRWGPWQTISLQDFLLSWILSFSVASNLAFNPLCTYKIATESQGPEGTYRPQCPCSASHGEGQPPNTAHRSSVSVQPRAVGVHPWPGLPDGPWTWFIPLPCWGLSMDTLTSTWLCSSHSDPMGLCPSWGWPALGHSQCLVPRLALTLTDRQGISTSNEHIVYIYEHVWINGHYIYNPKERQLMFGTMWSPGISGTGRFPGWSTGCPLHDLITSQAAYGNESGGRVALAYYGDGKCLTGFRLRLCSGLSKAELNVSMF